MAGRIRAEDVAAVRERARIEEVVGERVQLRSAGGGSLKGLCPFHDEKSPSFQVSPAKGLFYCFGCQVGGDVFDFLVKLDHLTFSEAVEQLAGRAGVQLRYEEAGSAPGRQQGQRTRLIAAHKAAADYYQAQLATPEAEIGRRFLAERGFDDEAAKRFGVGFAPNGWDHLTKHLRGVGFTDPELVTGGLVAEGQRGVYDRFRGRLVWPIRDLAGDVVGFGARRLREDDDGPKYLNTPETPIYKKGQVLYGLDVARQKIAKQQRAVIVEGYTDVMACHLAGVDTAIATCGTSFGGDHIKVLRRLLMDDDALRGEVIFTFDGDAAGQKAAVRAFADDQQFVTRTFVAVEASGLDPCELRQARGDEAVRALIDSRVPLFEFAIRSALGGENLTIPEGRIAALRQAAPVVARIRDVALREEYARRLSGWLGMEVRPVAEAVNAATRGARTPSRSQPAPRQGFTPPAQPPVQAPVQPTGQPSAPSAPPVEAARTVIPRPDPSDHRLTLEREVLKCAIQVPALLGNTFDPLVPRAFAHPAYAQLSAAVHAAGGVSVGVSDPQGWVETVRGLLPDDVLRGLVTELAVEPIMWATDVPDELYPPSVAARLDERLARKREVELHSALLQLDGSDPEAMTRILTELTTLQQQQRERREQLPMGSG
jgi:DNA primase